MVSNYETYLNFTFEILSGILRTLCKETGECHEHGAGFAWYQRGKWGAKRVGKPLWESPELRQLINWTRSRAMILHARRATYPQYSLQGPKDENSHPYVGELMGFRWVLAHNGFIKFNRSRIRIRPQEKILEYRGSEHILSSYGIDSEIFFKIFLYELRDFGGEEPLNVIHVLENIIKSELIEDFHSFNMIIGSHRYVYALRYYNEDYEGMAEKYTMFYLIRSGSSEAGRALRKKSDEIDFFICSEPLTDKKWVAEVRNVREGFPEEKWEELKNKQIIAIPIANPQNYKIETID